MKLSDSKVTATLQRIRVWTLLFMAGLLLSGATAIPLRSELDCLVLWTGAEQIVHYPNSAGDPVWAVWLLKVRSGLNDIAERNPFVFYGTDWLAFGHFVIAVAFIGALRDPVRNSWLFSFGMISCLLVIPYAFLFGHVRGIPIWWRLIDCSFGILGLIPLWLCRQWTQQLERTHANSKLNSELGPSTRCS